MARISGVFLTLAGTSGVLASSQNNREMCFNTTDSSLQFKDGSGVIHKYFDNVPSGSISHIGLIDLNSTNYFHLTSGNHTDLTDSGNSLLHYHQADRDLSNSSGTLAVVNGGTGQTTYTNGQILVGSGTTLVKNTISGTTNQVTVTNGSGTITLSTPQNTHTTATPQFSKIGLGKTPTYMIDGYNGADGIVQKLYGAASGGAAMVTNLSDANKAAALYAYDDASTDYGLTVLGTSYGNRAQSITINPLKYSAGYGVTTLPSGGSSNFQWWIANMGHLSGPNSVAANRKFSMVHGATTADGTNYLSMAADYAFLYTQDASTQGHKWYISQLPAGSGEAIVWRQILEGNEKGLGIGITPTGALHVRNDLSSSNFSLETTNPSGLKGVYTEKYFNISGLNDVLYRDSYFTNNNAGTKKEFYREESTTTRTTGAEDSYKDFLTINSGTLGSVLSLGPKDVVFGRSIRFGYNNDVGSGSVGGLGKIINVAGYTTASLSPELSAGSSYYYYQVNPTGLQQQYFMIYNQGPLSAYITASDHSIILSSGRFINLFFGGTGSPETYKWFVHDETY